MSFSVIILTFNSERTIDATIRSALSVSDDVHIVDSYSNDTTLSIVKQFPVNIVQHPFENYGTQRNWASSNLPLKYDWELHLDADEKLSDDLIDEINVLKNKFPSFINGYYLPRLVYFLERPLRHGGMFPIWHMRLFRRGKGLCEYRLYDQHFYVEGLASKLSGALIDDMRMSLGEWVERHNKWAEAEAKELLTDELRGRIKGKIRGNPVERKRFLKETYYRLPLFIRPLLLFIYRYFIKMGFLDGKEGLIFYILQTFWFRFLVDAKLYEMLLTRNSKYKLKQK
jgi:glycosyltransferase involved in cell wall biosynthesis